MKNNKQKPANTQQFNFKQIPQIQLLNVEQLDSVNGGPAFMKLGDIKGESTDASR